MMILLAQARGGEVATLAVIEAVVRLLPGFMGNPESLVEDMLEKVAFLKGHKWTSMMIKRVYFGNWLRDYSQAVDVGTVKMVSAEAIRILLWVLGFMSFGYGTKEFEVTRDRLGCYRPEE